MGVTALVLLGGFICFYIVTEANGLFFFSESGPGDQRSAEVGQFVTSVEIPEEVLLCSHAKWNHDEEGIWSFQQIAEAFYQYGIKPWNFADTSPSAHVEDCVAALIIVAGECSPSSDPTKGCLAAATGSSGVFQTDFLLMIPGFEEKMPDRKVMNLCSSSFGAGYMIAPFLAEEGRSSLIGLVGGEKASIFTCYNAFDTVNEYGCDDPNAVPGVSYTNFIGPFCHKSMSSYWHDCYNGTNTCCVQWQGGGNINQPPFPEYYYERAREAGSDQFESICRQVALMMQ